MLLDGPVGSILAAKRRRRGLCRDRAGACQWLCIAIKVACYGARGSMDGYAGLGVKNTSHHSSVTGNAAYQGGMSV